MNDVDDEEDEEMENLDDEEDEEMENLVDDGEDEKMENLVDDHDTDENDLSMVVMVTEIETKKTKNAISTIV